MQIRNNTSSRFGNAIAFHDVIKRYSQTICHLKCSRRAFIPIFLDSYLFTFHLMVTQGHFPLIYDNLMSIR